MLVTVFCAPRDRPETTFALDVSPELELRDFVALCELESGIPAGEIQILYVEQPLIDLSRALGDYGVKDGDVVVLRQADRRPPPPQPAFPGLPQIDFRSITVPGTSSSTSQRAPQRQQPQTSQQPQPPQQLPQQQQQQQQRTANPPTPTALHGSGSSPQGLDDPALLQQMLLSNPHELSLLKERNPPLAEALLSGDLERFTKVLLEQQQDRARREQERIRLLTADPFDLDAQAKIEEDIRQHNVEENMTIAMEEAPESFGQVVMLYINCKVNGHPVKAFVDSGAQMTIMSQACAERCNIMRLVDRRWAGIAKGVGTQKIIGRVHLAQVQIEGDFLPCSFSILEDQPMDMLLGLDMLKRHQCSIDLKKSVLLISTTGTETCFLPEAELPECARLAYGAEGRGGDVRSDEMADRELAEALQRSIQESDTAEGQTTSQICPPLPPLPRSLDQLSTSTSSSQSSSSLDRSQSAPATMQLVPTAPEEENASMPPQIPHHSLWVPTDLSSTTISTPPEAECIPKCIPPADEAVSVDPEINPEIDVPLVDSKMDAESDQMMGCMLSQMEELSPTQPMDQEANGLDTGAHGQQSPDRERTHEHLHQLLPIPPSLIVEESSPGESTSAADPNAIADPYSVEMESPTTSQGTERVQPAGEHCSGSDNIPSLAAALLELHELLVSNSCTQVQDRSASCSPSQPFRQDADGLDDSSDPRTLAPVENTQPAPSTALTPCAEPSVAKGNQAGPEEAPSECLHPDPSGQEEQPGGGVPETAEMQRPPLFPDSSCEGVADGGEQGDASDVIISEPAPAGRFAPAGDRVFREPPEGQQGRGVADGSASAIPDTLGQSEQVLQSPLSMAVGSSGEVSSTSGHPAPLHPFTEPFPAEHIQRIQAAGFSAREATEALEQAHGIVELALLALLARGITVPT